MDKEFIKLTPEELEKTAGGTPGYVGSYNYAAYNTVDGLASGWLALRTKPCYDPGNEVGRLYNGDIVQITGPGRIVDNDFDKNGPTTYVWVYSPDLNMSGWVNARFLR